MKVFLAVMFFSVLLNADAFERKDLSLTVYNQNMALVRDVRQTDFKKGVNTLKFRDVASSLIPESVLFKPLTNTGSISVLEQNYEYDLVNATKLLQKYVDKKIKILTKDDNIYQGVLSSFDLNQIVLVAKGQEAFMVNRENIRSVEFPRLPEGLITKPTLVWLVKSARQVKCGIELNYLTNNINWHSDYVANISPKDDFISLNGWVTINNNSGASYKDASIKLIAGDVHRVKERRQFKADTMFKVKALREAAPQFKEKSFFEYHMYTLSRRATVKNNQQKQISLLSAARVPAKKVYEYKGANYSWYYYDDWKNKRCNKKVNVKLKFKNSKNNGLGIPLPKGKIRVYKADVDKTLQFIGEDSIDHTPKDETVELYLGNAFDIVGERKITSHYRLSPNRLRDSYKIVIRNHKKIAVTVNIIEKQWGDWKIIEKNHKYKKKDAFTIEFPVRVAPNDKAIVTYTAEYLFI